MPGSSDFEFEITIEKLERHKSRDIYQFQAELLKAGAKVFVLRFVNILIIFGIRRNFLNSGGSQSL